MLLVVLQGLLVQHSRLVLEIQLTLVVLLILDSHFVQLVQLGQELQFLQLILGFQDFHLHHLILVFQLILVPLLIQHHLLHLVDLLHLDHLLGQESLLIPLILPTQLLLEIPVSRVFRHYPGTHLVLAVHCHQVLPLFQDYQELH